MTTPANALPRDAEPLLPLGAWPWERFPKAFNFYWPTGSAETLLPIFECLMARLAPLPAPPKVHSLVDYATTWVTWFQRDISTVTDAQALAQRWHTLVAGWIRPAWPPEPEQLRRALSGVSNALHPGRYGDAPPPPDVREDLRQRVAAALARCPAPLQALWCLGLRHCQFGDKRLDAFLDALEAHVLVPNVEALRAALPELPKDLRHHSDLWLSQQVDRDHRYTSLSDPMSDFMDPESRWLLDECLVKPKAECSAEECFIVFNRGILPGGTVEELLPWFEEALRRLDDPTSETPEAIIESVSLWLLYQREDIAQHADWLALYRRWRTAIVARGLLEISTTPTKKPKSPRPRSNPHASFFPAHRRVGAATHCAE